MILENSIYIFTIGTTVGVDIKNQENKVGNVYALVKLCNISDINTKTRDFLQAIGRSRFLHFGIPVYVVSS
jgi:hypothetical protein